MISEMILNFVTSMPPKGTGKGATDGDDDGLVIGEDGGWGVIDATSDEGGLPGCAPIWEHELVPTAMPQRSTSLNSARKNLVLV